MVMSMSVFWCFPLVPSIEFLWVLSQGYPLLCSASVVKYPTINTQTSRFNHFRYLSTTDHLRTGLVLLSENVQIVGFVGVSRLFQQCGCQILQQTQLSMTNVFQYKTSIHESNILDHIYSNTAAFCLQSCDHLTELNVGTTKNKRTLA